MSSNKIFWKLLPAILKVAMAGISVFTTISKSHGQTGSPSGCILAGADTVYAGSSASFTLSSCSASSWSSSCGILSVQSSNSATINFAIVDCGTALISASTDSGNISKTVIVLAASSLEQGDVSSGNQSIGYGKVPIMISTQAATGGGCGGSYSYQWLSSIDNVNFTPIPGAISQDYQPGPLTSTTYFFRQASCAGSSGYSTSDTVQILVNGPIGITTISPGSQSVAVGTAPSALALVNQPAKTNTAIQWESSTSANFVGATYIPGATMTTYAPGPLDTTTYFMAVMVLNGDTIFSTPAIVTIQPPLQGGSISPASQSIAYDSVPLQMSDTGVSGGNGNYSYQWQSSTDSLNWSALDGVYTSNYSPGGLTATTYFRVVISSNGIQVTSSPAVVYVAPAPTTSVIRNPLNKTPNSGL